MADGVRITDQSVASHARLVYENVIPALRDAFDSFYNRERQLVDLRITQDYPLKKIDYPSIVVEYQPQRIVNAGVGHVEWFTDPYGHFRKWRHSRFEGTLNLRTSGLSTKDRDILSDAVAELVRFGHLDTQLNRFYQKIYPSDYDLQTNANATGTSYSLMLFGQLALDSDQLQAVGNSAQIAPWAPEDLLVYQGGWSCRIHGAYYNSIPTVDWSRVTRIEIDAYIQDTTPSYHDHLEIAWTPPLVYADAAQVSGSGVISATVVEEHAARERSEERR